MHQQLWGYKVEEKLYVGVREQKRWNTTGINNYHTTPPNIPEERRSHQHSGASLKSKLFCIFGNTEYEITFTLLFWASQH
jgi:hypothetical protein